MAFQWFLIHIDTTLMYRKRCERKNPTNTYRGLQHASFCCSFYQFLCVFEIQSQCPLQTFGQTDTK